MNSEIITEDVETVFKKKYKIIREMKDNKKNGIYKIYNDNDQLILKTTYKDDMKEGHFIKYFSKYPDQIEYKTYFKSDKMLGERIVYHLNGQISLKEYYIHDLPHGFFQEYDLSGKLINTSIWIYGRKILIDEYNMYREEFKKIQFELVKSAWHPDRVFNWCLV